MILFGDITARLLKEKRVNGFFVQKQAEPPTNFEVAAFDSAFNGKTAKKGGGRELPWGRWLVESLFPTFIYQEHGQNLRKLVSDPQVWKLEGFSGNDNNSFGRMARPREEVPEGFVNFMLDRWKGDYRGMPQYFFDVEYPEWVVAPLSGRPDVPKTGRTAVSCVMLYGFQWLNEQAHITIMLRHLNWSHAWGDVFGAEEALRAICKELKLPKSAMGNVNIFANSASMDEPQAAKKYLKEIGYGIS